MSILSNSDNNVTHSFCLKGNIIPSNWNKLIRTSKNNIDHVSIDLLSEIVYRIRFSLSNNVWQTSYKYFENKFSYHREALRRAFVRLEKSDILERSYRTITIQGQKYNNVLFLNLNLSHPLFKSTLEDKKICNPVHKIATPYPLIGGDYIYKEIKEKNRSNKSNFNKIKKEIEEKNLIIEKRKEQSQTDQDNKLVKERNLKSKELSKVNQKTKLKLLKIGQVKQPIKQLNTGKIIELKVKGNIKHNKEKKAIIEGQVDNQRVTRDITYQSKKPRKFFSKILGKFSLVKRPLKEYLPITQESAEKLNQMCGREFSCHFMNKLAEKLGNKNPELKFYKEELFLQYMSQVLKNELRNPYSVNNTNFRFKGNSEEEKEEEKVEQYLEEIEQSIVMTDEGKLRRKIVGLYEEKIAYSLLLGMRIEKIEEKIIIGCSNDAAGLLNQRQKELLLQEIKLIYGNHIQRIEWKIEKRRQNSKVLLLNNANDGNKKSDLIDANLKIQNNEKTLWSKVKTELIRSYGTATYISWFNKLNTEEDLEKKLLILTAPTEFIKRWIKANYEERIKEICQNLSIQMTCIQ